MVYERGQESIVMHAKDHIAMHAMFFSFVTNNSYSKVNDLYGITSLIRLISFTMRFATKAMSMDRLHSEK